MYQGQFWRKRAHLRLNLHQAEGNGAKFLLSKAIKKLLKSLKLGKGKAIIG